MAIGLRAIPVPSGRRWARSKILRFSGGGNSPRRQDGSATGATLTRLLTARARRDITRLIRLKKPDVVVTLDPTRFWYETRSINHPDHRAAAQAACEAVFPSAGTRLIFADLLSAGYEPHDVKRLYIHGTDKSDTWVDITETLDVKIKALQQHASQVPVDEVGKWMTEWAEEEAKDKGMKYAESYKVMILKKDEEDKVG